MFKKEKCLISNQKNLKLTLNGVRKGDLFIVDWNLLEMVKYFVSMVKLLQMIAGCGIRSSPT